MGHLARMQTLPLPHIVPNFQGHQRMVCCTAWGEESNVKTCNLFSCGFDRRVLGWQVREEKDKWSNKNICNRKSGHFNFGHFFCHALLQRERSVAWHSESQNWPREYKLLPCNVRRHITVKFFTGGKIYCSASHLKWILRNWIIFFVIVQHWLTINLLY